MTWIFGDASQVWWLYLQNWQTQWLQDNFSILKHGWGVLYFGSQFNFYCSNRWLLNFETCFPWTIHIVLLQGVDVICWSFHVLEGSWKSGWSGWHFFSLNFSEAKRLVIHFPLRQHSLPLQVIFSYARRLSSASTWASSLVSTRTMRLMSGMRTKSTPPSMTLWLRVCSSSFLPSFVAQSVAR